MPPPFSTAWSCARVPGQDHRPALQRRSGWPGSCSAPSRRRDPSPAARLQLHRLALRRPGRCPGTAPLVEPCNSAARVLRADCDAVILDAAQPCCHPRWRWASRRSSQTAARRSPTRPPVGQYCQRGGRRPAQPRRRRRAAAAARPAEARRAARGRRRARARPRTGSARGASGGEHAAFHGELVVEAGRRHAAVHAAAIQEERCTGACGGLQAGSRPQSRRQRPIGQVLQQHGGRGRVPADAGITWPRYLARFR